MQKQSYGCMVGSILSGVLIDGDVVMVLQRDLLVVVIYCCNCQKILIHRVLHSLQLKEMRTHSLNVRIIKTRLFSVHRVNFGHFYFFGFFTNRDPGGYKVAVTHPHNIFYLTHKYGTRCVQKCTHVQLADA